VKVSFVKTVPGTGHEDQYGACPACQAGSAALWARRTSTFSWCPNFRLEGCERHVKHLWGVVGVCGSRSPSGQTDGRVAG